MRPRARAYRFGEVVGVAARGQGKRSRQGFPALEWLDEVAGGAPRVMTAGNHRAVIENHTGILEFDAGRVRLMTRQGVMTIRGAGLILAQVRPDALTVRGGISAIELPNAETDAE